MTFRCPYVDLARRTLALTLLMFGLNSRAQNVILHLSNGDRIAGVIVSENTNQVVLSTAWAKELAVPMSQIERREIPPPGMVMAMTNAFGTNLITGKTNLLAGVKTGAPSPNTNTFWRRWSGEAGVGLDLERGATDHQLYYAKAKLTYAQPYVVDPKEFFRNILNYDFAYGKTDGTTSDDRLNGSAKTDFDLTRRYYIYNLGGAGYDRVRLIDLQYEEGPGLGYHWLTQSNFLVNLELGANYQVQDRTDGTRTDSAYYRLAEDLTWKMRKDMTLTEKFEYFPKVGYAEQFRMRFECNLSYALPFHLALNFTEIDLYDTQPADTVPNNDFQFRTSLSAKF
jgi:putative salt-induced outer membrane protein YdiY